MKFGTLLKKEISQLLTKQAIISMIATVAIYVFMGQVMGSTLQKAEEKADQAAAGGNFSIVCCDSGEFANKMIEDIRSNGTQVEILSTENDPQIWQNIIAERDLDNLTVIPEDFSQNVENEEPAKIKLVSKVTGTGLANMIDSLGATTASNTIEDYLEKYYSDKYGVSEDELEKINAPSTTVELTSANGKIAEVAPDQVMGLISSVSMIMPIAIFMLLMTASSMVMTAISTEKIDKTLETLLSSPVSRVSVLAAKVLAAIITALINALVMMGGFAFYMNGMSGGALMKMNMGSEQIDLSEAASQTDALAALGVNLGAGDIVLIFLELFLSLAIGLCIALIIGCTATDAQSVQTVMMPVMFLTMIPFFVTMFTDINTMSLPGKILMFIIPFTHTYTAAGNLIFGHTGMLIAGIAYQLVFLGLIMYAAVKIFTSDLLFTMQLFKPKGKKKGAAEAE